jgi:antitoxin component YwqK of YwqJK toxin-antitoxin module
MGKVMSNPEVIRKYFGNGIIWNEDYYINGSLHKEDGPAHRCYFPNGNLCCERYYLNGERLTKEEWYSKLSSEHRVNLLYGKGDE